MNKQEYYEDISRKITNFHRGEIQTEADHVRFGLEWMEQLAKEFAEWVMKRGFVYVNSEYRNFQQLSDRSKDYVKTYDELFNDFITEKTKQ